MALVQAAPFTFRDFLQSILPGLIAASLFVPYLGSGISEEIWIGVALLSYVISTPVSKAAGVMRCIPFLRGKIKKIETRQKWLAENWNYDRLFYTLSNEDREYLYLTGAYVRFFWVTAFYFLVYLAVQLQALVKACFPVAQSTAEWANRLVAVQTPLLGKTSLPTLAITAVVLVILWFLLADFLNEFEILFADQYVEFARKYHSKVGGIAVSIWGDVTEAQKPIEAAKVILETTAGELIDQQHTNEKGQFRFLNRYDYCSEQACRVRVQARGCTSVKGDLPTDGKWLPPVAVILKPVSASSNDLEMSEEAKLSVREAAEAISVTKGTLRNYITSDRVNTNPDGTIDVAELRRAGFIIRTLPPRLQSLYAQYQQQQQAEQDRQRQEKQQRQQQLAQQRVQQAQQRQQQLAQRRAQEGPRE